MSEALRSASDTSYFKDGDTLWVKVVSDASGGRAPPPTPPPGGPVSQPGGFGNDAAVPVSR